MQVLPVWLCNHIYFNQIKYKGTALLGRHEIPKPLIILEQVTKTLPCLWRSPESWESLSLHTHTHSKKILVICTMTCMLYNTTVHLLFLLTTRWKYPCCFSAFRKYYMEKWSKEQIKGECDRKREDLYMLFKEYNCFRSQLGSLYTKKRLETKYPQQANTHTHTPTQEKAEREEFLDNLSTTVPVIYTSVQILKAERLPCLSTAN